MLATCTCCFAPQTEATHLTVVVKRRALIHNLSVCHGTQECESLLVACSFSSVCCVLALQRSCLVQLEHLYSGPSLSLCCPTPQHPVQTEPAPLSNFPLTSVANQMIVSTQNREDWICFAQKIKTFVFLFSLPLRVCDFTLSVSHGFILCCLYFILFGL